MLFLKYILLSNNDSNIKGKELLLNNVCGFFLLFIFNPIKPGTNVSNRMISLLHELISIGSCEFFSKI